ncbi:MAG: acyl-CoA reductase [Bacteroidetes bacterium]|nr:acyl-CoA reductase [Bacteroidota bacterium]
MKRSDKVEIWAQTGEVLRQIVNGEKSGTWNQKLEDVAIRAAIQNPWFTRPQLQISFEGISKMLEYESLKNWTNSYPEISEKSFRVGVIMAGNIPMAGFHDLLAVNMSGNHLVAKMSVDDKLLIPFILEILFSIAPELKNEFETVDRLNDIEAIIATGSNNTGRYFEHYFGKYPHIFRKNRNSAAILTGNENEFDLILLGKDIFTYFGLGCRNVSKIFIPKGYVLDEFFLSQQIYSEVMQHNKYMNNFDYHQALYLLNRQPFLTNNFLILTENESLASPVSVVHYEYYDDTKKLDVRIKSLEQELQCVVSKQGKISFGQAQFPAVTDYADNIDTMAFLTTLKK